MHILVDMTYQFKSKSADDVIMLEASGNQVMRIIGKEPAEQGIIKAGAMPLAISAVMGAVAKDDAARLRAWEDARAEGVSQQPGHGVALRQRVGPLVEMMKRAFAHHADVVWRT